MQYFISLNRDTIGPMSADQVMAYPVNRNTQVCTVDDYTWKPLYNFPELMELINARDAAGRADAYNAGKDRIVAGVLAILIGGIGAQYIYLGKIGAFIITLILSLVSCGLWSLVMFVQGIYMLTLTPEQFDTKYTYSTSTYPLF